MHPSSMRVKKSVGAMVANEPLWLRVLLIGAAYLIIGALILVPITYVFVQAFSEGWSGYINNLVRDKDTLHSIWLTLSVAPLAVLFNTVLGVAAAWCLTRFKFPGRTLLVTLLDVPFAISPVVVGLMFLVLFGMQGYLRTDPAVVGSRRSSSPGRASCWRRRSSPSPSSPAS